MTGREIVALMEDIADNLFHPDPYYRQGGDMLRVGGLTYTIEPARTLGRRIRDVAVGGRPLEPARPYQAARWASGGGAAGPPAGAAAPGPPRRPADLARGARGAAPPRRFRRDPGPREGAVGQRPVARAAAEEDERPAGHPREPRAALPRRPRGRTRDQDERVVAQRERLDLGVVEGAREPDLRVPPQDHLEDLLRVPRADGHERLRRGALEALQDVGQEVRADREHGRDLERAAGGRPEVVDGLAAERHGPEELLRVGARGAARRRRRATVLSALEELHAERGLEPPDARAHRRLSEPQRVGRTAGAAEGADREEPLDLRDLHARDRGVCLIDKDILSRI